MQIEASGLNQTEKKALEKKLPYRLKQIILMNRDSIKTKLNSVCYVSTKELEKVQLITDDDEFHQDLCYLVLYYKN